MIIKEISLNGLAKKESERVEKKFGLEQAVYNRKQIDVFYAFVCLGDAIRERCKEGKELHWRSNITLMTKSGLHFFSDFMTGVAEVGGGIITLEDVKKRVDEITILEDALDIEDIPNVENIEKMSDEELVENFVKTIFLFLNVYSEKTLESLHLFYIMTLFAQKISGNRDWDCSNEGNPITDPEYDEEQIDKLFDYLKFYYDYNFGRFD